MKYAFWQNHAIVDATIGTFIEYGTTDRDKMKESMVGSTGQRNGSFKGISRRLEAKRFSRPRVEPQGDLIEVMLSVNR